MVGCKYFLGVDLQSIFGRYLWYRYMKDLTINKTWCLSSTKGNVRFIRGKDVRLLGFLNSCSGQLNS